MTPQIVDELRRENASLRAAVTRWQRQEEWVAEIAKRRIGLLETELRRTLTYVSRKRVVKVLNAYPEIMPARRERGGGR